MGAVKKQQPQPGIARWRFALVAGLLCLLAVALVVHLAGLQVPTCRVNPPVGAFVNVVGTLHVFEAARAIGAERVVYASSAAVFGLSDEAVDEQVVPEPLTHYGVFKRANEGSARVYYRDHGLSSIGLRPYSVYGVGRDAGITSDPTRAMKAALISHSKTLAVSLAAKKIRVNVVAPGSIEFPGGGWDRMRQNDRPFYDSVLARIPWGRMGTVDEVADAVVFLASSRASWITGACLTVDGGQHKGNL